MVVALIGVGAMLMGNEASCEDPSQKPATTASYAQDANTVEATQAKVQKAVPIPKITTSAERKNISARATFFDNENLTTYIYLISYGKVMAFFPVKGKVSSLNSYLSPVDKIVKADGSPCDRNYSYSSYGNTWEPCYVVGAPDIDGAYGENREGIFFYTADTGSYVEWPGEYMVSSQPLKMSTAVELTREVK